jgi:malonate decarboxylase delta subunit
MEVLKVQRVAKSRAGGSREQGILGVVASGNLEVLFERVIPGTACEIEIATPMKGYDDIWQAVLEDFITRCSPGGLRISINDGGARPDTVALRLMQGVAMMEAE